MKGLPSDELSLQNAAIVTKALNYPLLIDPQGQGKIWLRTKEQHNEMLVTNLRHKYFRSEWSSLIGPDPFRFCPLIGGHIAMLTPTSMP